MRLVVTTPTVIAVDEDRVTYVRAEDASGSFGIEPHHANLLTTLAVGVVRWRGDSGRDHYVAVRGGVLRARDGKLVEIATREAVVSDDLALLRGQVASAMAKDLEAEHSTRSGVLRLEHAAIRQVVHYLRPADQPQKLKPRN
jgi:F-type H+-transporting ATPase subunit epsilon